MRVKEKPKLAVYKLSSCAGCQLQLLNLEPVLLDLAEVVDIKYFVMAGESAPGPYDLGLVEGAVTCGEEILRLKEAREQCRTLVALGSCACFGGVPSIKNWVSERVVEGLVYPDTTVLHSTKAYGVDQYVTVDGYLRGCPVSRDEVVELINALRLGIQPRPRLHAVCMECKLRENPCLWREEGLPCLGPVTAAGCGALCPTNGRACEGCRGPSSDANTLSLARSWREAGLSKHEVARRFRKFAGLAPEFEQGARAV